MKKLAIVLVLAVLAPSLVLAWLALRSMNDQEYVLERERILAHQSTVDRIKLEVNGELVACQREFRALVDRHLESGDADDIERFDALIREEWPLAEVGFVVDAQGELLVRADGEKRPVFLAENAEFLSMGVPAAIYAWTEGDFFLRKAMSGSAGEIAQAAAPSSRAVSDSNSEEFAGGRGNAGAERLGAAPGVTQGTKKKTEPRMKMRGHEEAGTDDAQGDTADADAVVAEAPAEYRRGGAVESAAAEAPAEGLRGAEKSAPGAEELAEAAKREMLAKMDRDRSSLERFELASGAAEAKTAELERRGGQGGTPQPLTEGLKFATPDRLARAPREAAEDPVEPPKASRNPFLQSAVLPQPTAVEESAAPTVVARRAAATAEEPREDGAVSSRAAVSAAEPEAEAAPPVPSARRKLESADTEKRPVVMPSGALIGSREGRAEAPVAPGAAAQKNPQTPLRTGSRERERLGTAADPGARTTSPHVVSNSGAAVSQLSSLHSAEYAFEELTNRDASGIVARFVGENTLRVLLWYRPSPSPSRVFGAQMDLSRLASRLAPLLQSGGASNDGDGIAVALLDHRGIPEFVNVAGFAPADWKRPFVAEEIGRALPHWEIATYLVDPHALTAAAKSARFKLALIVMAVVAAIGFGSALVVTDIRRQVRQARAKTDFVSSVSHELKTPLTSIRMFSDLLSESDGSNPEKTRKYAGVIGVEAARLTRLINNVLDFSRLERGEKKVCRQRMALFPFVSETVDHYRTHIEKEGIELLVRGEDVAAEVDADKDALSQVLVNLLSNAEKYGADGGEITVGVREDGDEVVIDVCDRGPGVPEGTESKIFERFFRAADSLSSGVEGCGLGLTLARDIVTAHGGELAYRRRAGGGSSFSVRLPKAQ